MLFSDCYKLKQNFMNYSEHTKKVSDCMKEINLIVENRKLNIRSKTKNKKLIESIIKEKSKAYGLKNANIEIIFFGLTIINKANMKKFNDF